MQGLNLCIDIDGTVTEAYDWISRANDYFHTKVSPKDVCVYEIHEVLGVDRKAYDEFYERYAEVIHEESNIRTGVKEVLDKMYPKHSIHFVTAREEKLKNVTTRWFTKYQIPFHTLSLLGTHNKVAKAHELKCDIFIEDRYENALQLSKAGFEVLLMDCNYNQEPLNSKITRVKNWYQIACILNKNSIEKYNSFKIAT